MDVGVNNNLTLLRSTGYRLPMRRLVASFFSMAAILVLLTSSARAAEITDVASSFEPGHPFGFRLRLGYSHLEKRAVVKREVEKEGQPVIGLVNDLDYKQSRDALNLRMEIGLFWDLMVYLEIPLVLNDSRQYSLDPALGGNSANSTTVRDGIQAANGFDSNTGAGFAAGLVEFKRCYSGHGVLLAF